MLTSVNSGSAALKAPKKSMRSRAPLSPDQQLNANFKLSQSLQTTLDLSELLEMFLNHLQEIMQVSGLKYQHDSQELNIQMGGKGVHHCDYRLITPQNNLGEIIFNRSKRFNDAELTTLETLLGLLVYPLRNALQYREAVQKATQDPLTGTGNRVALDGALKRELLMAERYQQALSMLVIDIDLFKDINDKFGHSCGDDVIREVAHATVSVTRDTDMTFRYGGEEFVVILTKTAEDEALIIAERIREFIAMSHISSGGQKLSTSVSIGVSSLQSNDGVKDLFIRADRALYEAKKNGRNCVMVQAANNNNKKRKAPKAIIKA